MEFDSHLLESLVKADKISMPTGAFVCLEGSVCQVVPFVTSGVVRVYKMSDEGREITLYRVVSGQTCVITTSCVANSAPFPAYAVAETDVTAWAVPAQQFREWLDASSAWRNYIFSQMLGRLSDVIELVEAVAFARMDQRLQEYLSHAERPTLFRTHERIAADLGTSREVVSRLLKDLERKGTVKLRRGEIDVLGF
jgi:CRP/FNR family transcriptional regulator, anaerobic regulatory protein